MTHELGSAGKSYSDPKDSSKLGDICINILAGGLVFGIIAFPIFLLELDKPAKEPAPKTENIIQRKETINNDTVYIAIHNYVYTH